MFEAAPHTPLPPANDMAPNPAVLRAERRLRLLEEMTEAGMKQLRALAGGAASAEAKDRDPVDDYARLTRALRLTISLEAKTDQELRDLEAGIVRERQESQEKRWEKPTWTQQKADNYRFKLWRLVGDTIDAEAETEDEAGLLYQALEERLDEDQAYRDCLDRPMRETVGRLCKDLAITPDMSRWDEEGHIHPPIRPRHCPFKNPSRVPLLVDDDEPSQAQPQPDGHDLE